MEQSLGLGTTTFTFSSNPDNQNILKENIFSSQYISFVPSELFTLDVSELAFLLNRGFDSSQLLQYENILPVYLKKAQQKKSKM